jgi:hypothetical protein
MRHTSCQLHWGGVSPVAGHGGKPSCQPPWVEQPPGSGAWGKPHVNRTGLSGAPQERGMGETSYQLHWGAGSGGGGGGGGGGGVGRLLVNKTNVHSHFFFAMHL